MQNINIGCQTYSKTAAIAIMKQPTSGDMTYALVAQLIAAKLNVDCASNNSSCVSAAIAAVNNWLCSHPVGSNVKASSSDWKNITPSYNTLGSYNEGKLCASARK